MANKVLHVINGEYYAGAERVQDLLGEGLPQHGWSVSFAALKVGVFSSRRTSKDSPVVSFPARGFFDLGRVRRLTKWGQAERFSVVHSHTPIAGFIGTRLAANLGVPLVHHVHSPTLSDTQSPVRNQVKAAIERRVIRRAAKLVAVAPPLVDYLIERGAEPSSIQLIENGIKPVACIRRQRDNLAEFVFGIAAFFRPRKGVETLVRAFASLCADYPMVRLRIIGEFETSAYRKQITALVDELGVSPQVDWVGFSEDISKELSRIDVFVVPSLYGEGLPMVLLEAMSAGLPIIASDIDGVNGPIVHGRTGLLFPPGDSPALTRLMSDTVSNQETASMLSKNALEAFWEKYSWERMVGDVAKVYSSVSE